MIQKKDSDALDFSSVLFFNIGFSVFLYLILFFSAPFISKFYGEGYEILTPVLRVLGLRLIFSAINSVQQAYVSREMMFKKFFWATLIGTIISGVIGIIMAYYNFGIWSLVAQYLFGTTINTITLSVLINRKPIRAFSIKRLKGLLGFGSRMLLSSLLVMGYEELRALIIGKLYSSEDLAFYDKGKQFPSLVVTNINTSIGAVLFPKMSKDQDDTEKIKETARNSMRFSSFIMFPVMLGMLAVAEPFVRVVLTDKWLPCVHLLQWFCILYLFHPIHTANMQAIKAIGRSDIYLRLEIIKKIIELAVLLVVMRISVDAMVISAALLSVTFTFINAYPNKKLLGYTFSEQIKDILPALIMASVMAVLVFLINFVEMNLILKLVLQVFIGAVIYVVLAFVTKNKEFKYVLSFIKRK